jgi:hypothetical protein
MVKKGYKSSLFLLYRNILAKNYFSFSYFRPVLLFVVVVVGHKREKRKRKRENRFSFIFFVSNIFFFIFFRFISFLFFIRNEKQCKTTDKCRQQREASQAKDPGNYKMTFGSDRDENTERKKKNGAKKTLKKIVFAK